MSFTRASNERNSSNHHITAWVEEFRGDFTGGAEKLVWSGGEGKQSLNEFFSSAL